MAEIRNTMTAGIENLHDSNLVASPLWRQWPYGSGPQNKVGGGTTTGIMSRNTAAQNHQRGGI
jgi:hypothetical protein